MHHRKYQSAKGIVEVTETVCVMPNVPVNTGQALEVALGGSRD
jgi:hypothetical protein